MVWRVEIMSATKIKSTIVLSVVTLLLVSTTGLASAGYGIWIDPPIDGTPLHLWFNPENGSDYKITTHERDGGVAFRTRVRNRSCEGQFEAGINASAVQPGDWNMHEFADCGNEIEFTGVWFDGQVYTEDEFREVLQQNHDADDEHEGDDKHGGQDEDDGHDKHDKHEDDHEGDND